MEEVAAPFLKGLARKLGVNIGSEASPGDILATVFEKVLEVLSEAGEGGDGISPVRELLLYTEMFEMLGGLSRDLGRSTLKMLPGKATGAENGGLGA